MIKNFGQIIKELEKKQYDPIYFLSGEEDFFIDKIENLIATKVLSESEKAFNQSIIYGKEAVTSVIFDLVMRFPMMSDYNVVIIREAQEYKKLDELSRYFENPNPQTILVICYKNAKIDKRTSLYKTIEKFATVLDAVKIKESDVLAQIKSYLQEHDFKITDNAASLLVEHMGYDLSRILNELEKLILIKKESGMIEVADIEKNVGISREYNIFELQKALSVKNTRQVVKFMQYLTGNPKAMPIQMMTSLLFTYFQRVFALQHGQVDSKDCLSRFGIQPFALGEFQTAARTYQGKVEKVMSILQEYDLRSKGVNDTGTDSLELTKEMLFKILAT